MLSICMRVFFWQHLAYCSVLQLQTANVGAIEYCCPISSSWKYLSYCFQSMWYILHFQIFYVKTNLKTHFAPVAKWLVTYCKTVEYRSLLNQVRCRLRLDDSNQAVKMLSSLPSCIKEVRHRASINRVRRQKSNLLGAYYSLKGNFTKLMGGVWIFTSKL